MAREMAEQPEVIGALLGRRHDFASRLRAIAPERLAGVVLIARGSSDNAAVYGRYVLEAALRRPVSMAAPSLWTRYGVEEDLRGYLAVGVSQSGRTPEIADTLERVAPPGRRRSRSPMTPARRWPRRADLAIDLRVGPEHAVPATKTVTAQLAAFAILATRSGPAVARRSMGRGAARPGRGARRRALPPRPRARRSRAPATTSSSAEASSTRSLSRAR